MREYPRRFQVFHLNHSVKQPWRRRCNILVDANIVILNITCNLLNFIKGHPNQIIKNEKVNNKIKIKALKLQTLQPKSKGST